MLCRGVGQCDKFSIELKEVYTVNEKQHSLGTNKLWHTLSPCMTMTCKGIRTPREVDSDWPLGEILYIRSGKHKSFACDMYSVCVANKQMFRAQLCKTLSLGKGPADPESPEPQGKR